VYTVCAPSDDVQGVRDVTVSLPRLVGGAGVLETFPLPLSAVEQTQLRQSAEVIRQAIDELQRANANEA
jgi:L-lactate dehydrogenase